MQYYIDATMTIMASKITCTRVFLQPFVLVNFEALITGPFGESIYGRWIPLTKGQ